MSRARDLADYVSTGVTSTELDKLDGLTATTDELNLVDGSVSGPLSHRNMVINGGMEVAQRSVGPVSVSDGSNEGFVTVDRWKINFGSSMGGGVDVSQSNAPSGSEFSKALKIEVTTATTPTSAQFFNPTYAIEGQDLQHLQYGTSSAKTMALSFSIYTNKAGTYGLALRNYDQGRVIGKTFTVDSANTWQRITVVFEGDTAQAIDNDNGNGLHIWFGFGVGASRMSGSSTWSNYSTAVYPGSSTTNFFDTVGNILYLTGVQLELGSVATPFEHRSYGDELQRCQRYYHEFLDTNDSSEDIGICSVYRDYQLELIIRFPVEMRAVPTKTAVGGTNYFTAYGNLSNDSFDNFSNTGNLSKKGTLVFTSSSDNFSGTQGQARRVRKNNSGASIAFDAEL